MPELTTEEKAKRYDEAIKIAKSKIRYDKDHILNEDDIIAMFPELKKSEDEIIGKALLEMVNDTKGDDLWINYNVHKEDAAAWLEKQTDNENISLLRLKAKAYDDAKERMSYAYNQNRVPIGFIHEIFPNLKLYKTQDKTHVTQYCCILNFNTGEVFKHCIAEDEANLNTVDLLRKYGFKESECSIMYTSNNLELKLLEN